MILMMKWVRVSWLAPLLALALLLQGCGPRVESYVKMDMTKVGGRPYVILQTLPVSAEDGDPYFGVYTPRGNDVEDWQPVAANLRGFVNGTYIAKKDSTEQLGLFHDRRITVIDVASPQAQVNVDSLMFDWPAETSVELKGVTYAFGMERDDAAATFSGRLRAAKFDGQKWEELPALGPPMSFPEGTAGFSLQAAAYQDSIKIFWRDLHGDQALDAGLEGRRDTAQGPAFMASFDGEKFAGAAVSIDNLPRGNTCTWSDNEGIHILIQPRKKLEEGVNSGGPMEIWRVTSDGKAIQTDVLTENQPRPGLWPFLAAAHFTVEGQEYILRSNWQMFEVWQKDPSGWRWLARNPK